MKPLRRVIVALPAPWRPCPAHPLSMSAFQRLTDSDEEVQVSKGANPRGWFSPGANISESVNKRVAKKAERNQWGDHTEAKWLAVVLTSAGGFKWMNELNRRWNGPNTETDLGQFEGVTVPEPLSEVWIVWEKPCPLPARQETNIVICRSDGTCESRVVGTCV